MSSTVDLWTPPAGMSALDVKAAPGGERSALYVDTEIQVARSRKVALAVVQLKLFGAFRDD